MQQLDTDFRAVFGEIGGVLQQVEQPPAIAVRRRQEHLEAFVTEAQLAFAQPALFAQRALYQLVQRRLVETLEHIHRARDNSALFSSKDGFSVVAPMKIRVPSST